MSERPNEKQVSFFIDSKERQQFQELCKTTGVSASNVLRMWVQSALQAQVINVETPPDEPSEEPVGLPSAPPAPTVIG